MVGPGYSLAASESATVLKISSAGSGQNLDRRSPKNPNARHFEFHHKRKVEYKCSKNKNK